MPQPASEEEVPSCSVPDQLATAGAGVEGADVVSPPPEFLVVDSLSSIAQTKERIALMMAIKVFYCPIFTLSYLHI